MGTCIVVRNCVPGVCVALEPHSCKKNVAYGRSISSDNDAETVLVNITRVRIPSFVMVRRNNSTNVSKQSLSSFGVPPFDLTIPRKDLISENEAEFLASVSVNENQNETSRAGMPSGQQNDSSGTNSKLYNANEANEPIEANEAFQKLFHEIT